MWPTAVYDGRGPALYVGDDFTTVGAGSYGVGGTPSGHIAKWRLTPLFEDGFESGSEAAWSDVYP